LRGDPARARRHVHETTMEHVTQAEVDALVEEALPIMYSLGFAVKPVGAGAAPPATMAHAPFALLPRKVRGAAVAGV
jgi:hypothetical protein